MRRIMIKDNIENDPESTITNDTQNYLNEKKEKFKNIAKINKNNKKR